MSKAKLVFELPQEEEEFNHAQHGIDYHIAICAFDDALRNIVKHSYGDTEEDKKIVEHATWARERFHEVLKESGVSLYE